jgi:hypothetical protein
MRYLVRARVKSGCAGPLREAIDSGTLGRGSVAGSEYLRNMDAARQFPDGTVRWVEVCYCPTPLAEERPYWEAFFDLVRVQDSHDRRECRDWNRSESWACENCDCSKRLEERLAGTGGPFLAVLQSQHGQNS